MPNYGNFSIPFLGGGPTIAEQILQGLHEGATEKLNQQQLGLEKQRVTNETTRSALLNQYTQKQIEHETLQNAYEQETNPLKKKEALQQLTRSAYDNAELSHRLKFIGIDTDAIDRTINPQKPEATETDKPATETASPLQKFLDSETKRLGDMSTAETGILNSGNALFQSTGDPKHVLAALTDIYHRRIGAAGEPLGASAVDQLNKALAARFQVLNPDKELPQAFTLSPTSTQKDYDRIDKILDSTEKAKGIKAQQETANAIREQTLSMSKEKEGMQPVIGQDPATGKDILVPIEEAKKRGLLNPMKADADAVNKSQAARHWLQLADKQGDSPESMGLMQLIDKLDKEGKLGVAASRWNEFMAGKVGKGDPEFAALRAKMGLSATKLMQAHVGSRGGSFMLEHFEDLANAKKMDGPTLKAGVGSELNYMKDVAMLPEKSAASKKDDPLGIL